MTASPEVLRLAAYLELLENGLLATEGLIAGVFVNMNWVCRSLNAKMNYGGKILN